MIKVGAILAAGKGQRMGALAAAMPKALLQIGERPVILHQIEAMKNLGIIDIFVVVGHHRNQIMETLGDGSRLGLHIEYLEQDELHGTGHALRLLRPMIQSQFFLFLGDIIGSFENLNTMSTAIRGNPDASVIAVKRESHPDLICKNFSVDCRESNRVHRVVEKPVKPESDLKGIGIYLFSPRIFEAIDRTPRNPLRQEFELTDSIQSLVDSGHPVYAEEVMTWDINLTHPEDLMTANEQYRRSHRK